MEHTNGGIVGLDRKAMEEARLARLAQKRGAPSDVQQPPAKLPRPAEVTEISPPPSSRSSRPEEVQALKDPKDNACPVSRPSDPDGTNSPIQYQQGVVKKTWCFGFPRSNDIKIEEVLQARTLKTAVISSFVWDFDWLATKMDGDIRTKLVFIHQARNEDERDIVSKQFEGLKNIRLCFPPMQRWGCMHSKLMLLFHPTHLRLVVPTANFLAFDWGESGVMENSVFLIDLPRLPEDQQGSQNNTLSEFHTSLQEYLTAMQLHSDAINSLTKFDFSATAPIRFVHSIVGTHMGHSPVKTGYDSLSKAVASLSLSTPLAEKLETAMVASSIGALDSAQLQTMQRALRGLDPHVPKPKRPTKKSFWHAAEKEQSAPATAATPPDTNITQIMFPTRTTVANSKGGTNAGGTLFFKSEYYNKPTFPTECIREFTPTRKSEGKGPLSHNKLILGRTARNAFFYLGSHNFSGAAWGKLSTDKSGVSKCTVGNWECGVLVPVVRGGEEEEEDKVEETERNEANISTASEDETEDEEVAVQKGGRVSAGKAQSKDVLPFSVFERAIDVPFEWPPKKYAEAALPWSASG